MYKEIIIIVVVIASIITINCFLQDYTKNSITALTNELEELKQDLKEDDTTKTEEKMNKINATWQEIHNKLAMYIEHDELEKVRTDLVALEGFIEVQDYETSISELNKCVYVLEHIKQKHEFSLINIF